MHCCKEQPFHLFLGFVALLAVVIAAPVRADSDSDSVPDVADNCLLVPNTDQAATNSSEDDNTALAGIQSYGNLCDGDINNDGVVDGFDFAAYFLPCFIKGIVQSFPECATSDFDGDDFVTGVDFTEGCLPQFVVGTPGP